jgi:hypothetical protein
MADFPEHSELVPRSGPASTARPLTHGTRRWAFVLVDVNGGGVDVDPAAMADQLFNADNPASIRAMYRELSYGAQDLEGEVLGPFPYAFRPGQECDVDGLTAALAPRLPADGAFDQVLYYFGSRQSGCRWTGLADLGTATRPAAASYYNATHDCVVLVQESAHNLGMVHSSGLRCTADGPPQNDVPFSATGAGVCSHDEYGNPFDPMGRGCFHMNGVQKAYQGWLPGCRVARAARSGTYALAPLEIGTEETQLLQVPMARARLMTLGDATTELTSYYVELRTPVGLDRTVGTRVLVTVGGDLRDNRRFGGRNWLLDMRPETATMQDAALGVGRRFAAPEPGGPTITVVTADADGARIRVDLADGEDPEAAVSGDCRE